MGIKDRHLNVVSSVGNGESGSGWWMEHGYLE